NTLNHRCVTKKVFITEDKGGKRQTHYNIRTRVNKNGKRKKRKGRRESGGATKHRKPGQGREDSYGKHRTMYAAHTTELAKTDANATTLEKL
ncbi:hypothetical protein AAA126_17345, partial [Phocaeicola dorei]|uniref:hypothetical protein n=3 Tax=Phocaeicola dorei TaxID=357276 RepID=UPI0032C0ECC0